MQNITSGNHKFHTTPTTIYALKIQTRKAAFSFFLLALTQHLLFSILITEEKRVSTREAVEETAKTRKVNILGKHKMKQLIHFGIDTRSSINHLHSVFRMKQ